MMRTYDVQVHTNASPCSNAAPADVVAAASRSGLDGIVVTNHDTLEGVAAVQKAAPDELTVIPGVEVSTTQGHLLALDVEDVPPQSDPLSVIEHVHDLGGLAVLSHPFDRLREHYESDLDAIGSAVDAVEVLNSRCLRMQYNERARAFALEHDLSVTGGSDAHFPMEVGRAYTACDGPLLEALRRAETSSGGRARYLSGHAATKLHQLNESLAFDLGPRR